MEHQNLAIKLKDLRNRKGFSQEQLAEQATLSLRTIQRIEKGTSIPRGDTLVKLTQALDVTPDDLLEWTPMEDKGYLTLLNLSALGFFMQPILGIIIPLVMWILKREKVNQVDDTGKQLISFQITWTLLLYIVLMIATKGVFIPFDFNILQSFFAIIGNFSIIGGIIVALYLYNLTLIFVNVRRTQKGLPNRYKPAIPFLR
jgi:uncharacterized Tic20 family protein